ncbi:hypothetical protein L5G32_16285 [Gordonia sp. HY002]|uniref:hypothetical protein n=1 Tax=Gordonia zhenghanii TaxID=2911516 RepID=UPI001F36585E|nr:hypothetical protein [Gordonia zhenghanii]MCF8571828.1 hypothetical protein [Gordonia zhenghanii]
MNPLAVIVGFLPFIAFDVLSERDFHDAIGWAAVVALVLTAVFFVLGDKRHRGSSVLNGAAVGIFGVIAAMDFIGGPDIERWLVTWSAAVVMVALGAIILVMLPVRSFTEEIAKQTVPEEFWRTPTFIRVNRVLSALWGGAQVVLGLLSVVVIAVGDSGVDLSRGHLDLLLNWVIPIGVYIALIRFTIAYPERAKAAAIAARAGRPVEQTA